MESSLLRRGPVKIVRMRRGQSPAGADRIYITRLPDGTAFWMGAVGISATPVFGNRTSPLPSVAEAEEEAISWAQRLGATEIIIESDDA